MHQYQLENRRFVSDRRIEMQFHVKKLELDAPSFFCLPIILDYMMMLAPINSLGTLPCRRRSWRP